MTIKIEKDVPLPPPRGKKWQSKYPFELLNVNDSFFVEAGDRFCSLLLGSVRAIGKRFEERFGYKYTYRIIKEPKYGVRVWRIK